MEISRAILVEPLGLSFARIRAKEALRRRPVARQNWNVWNICGPFVRHQRHMKTIGLRPQAVNLKSKNNRK